MEGGRQTVLNAEGGKFLAAVCLPLARVQTAECQQVETKRLWLQRQGKRREIKGALSA